MIMKISCKECEETCCDNMTISLRENVKGVNPNNLKRGDWLCVTGITFVKKANGLWKCLAFDVKKCLCKIFKYRPPLCRGFQCKYAKRKQRKLPVNYKLSSVDRVYIISFNKKNPKGLK